MRHLFNIFEYCLLLTYTIFQTSDILSQIQLQFNLFERPLGLADRRGCTTTMVDNRDFLLFIWLELNDQRPTCSTRPRPLVFIDLKCFLLFIGLVWATTICPHFSVSESYLILRVWFEFSPLGKLSPLLNQSGKSTNFVHESRLFEDTSKERLRWKCDRTMKKKQFIKMNTTGTFRMSIYSLLTYTVYTLLGN